MSPQPASHTICIVVNEVEPRLVESCSQVRLSNTQTNTICEALAERTGSHFDTVGMTGLRMTGCQRIDLTELLEVIHGELVAK